MTVNQMALVVLAILTILMTGTVVLLVRKVNWVSRNSALVYENAQQLLDKIKEKDFALALRRSVDRDDEKQRRVYYQNIVYAVVVELDQLLGRKPGEGIVCGTIDHPSSQVQEIVSRLVREIVSSPALCIYLRTCLLPQEEQA